MARAVGSTDAIANVACWRGGESRAVELRRSYPTEDGAITDAGREQQIAVAVWVLGWLSGPLPAIVALIVRPGSGTYRRLLVVAAWFWAVIALLGAVVVGMAIASESMWPMIGWVALMAVAVVATGVAVRLALSRIGPSTNGRGGESSSAARSTN